MDQHVKDQLKANSVPVHHVDKLAQLPEGVQAAVNWPALIQLIATRGPGLVQDILTIFGGGVPSSVPTSSPKP